jgi:hypothetical protein
MRNNNTCVDVVRVASTTIDTGTHRFIIQRDQLAIACVEDRVAVAGVTVGTQRPGAADVVTKIAFFLRGITFRRGRTVLFARRGRTHFFLGIALLRSGRAGGKYQSEPEDRAGYQALNRKFTEHQIYSCVMNI